MTATWQAVAHSDLFTWFHLREVGVSSQSDGDEVRLKPAANAEVIDLTVRRDRTQSVIRGTLWMDRNWVGDGRVNPFAVDLASSFLRVVGQDAAFAQALAGALGRLVATHSSTPVLHRAEVPIAESASGLPVEMGPDSTPDNADVFVEAFLHSWAGGGERRMPDEWCVSIVNERSGEPARVRLEVSYVPEDCVDPLRGSSVVPRKSGQAIAAPWWRRMFRH